MTIIEKILALHSKCNELKPGDIVDFLIDARVARDFGGANVVKNLKDYGLKVDDPEKTFFTFDCNPAGSDQKYAVNQHICRMFARENGIKVYDINAGIGTHILIDEGLVYPSATAVSTDSHANILGSIGAFGQGMGDLDIAASWYKGKIWFKVPQSVKIILEGDLPSDITSKDVILNLLGIFGANSLLGYSVEIYGDVTTKFTLDDRITISSMATEMGAVIILFPPSDQIIRYCRERTTVPFEPVYADIDAVYYKTFHIDVSDFKPVASKPGKPHDIAEINELYGTVIDSGFIGSCTNGRLSDMIRTAGILKNRKVAPGVILKIVPSTNHVWDECLRMGIIEIFKSAGALVSNPGCAGCAAGQVGQNGPGEITISTGNRNFPGKQGKGNVYLASPDVVAASAIAGYITTPGRMDETPPLLKKTTSSDILKEKKSPPVSSSLNARPEIIEGRVWLIRQDNIDTDMIFHNRYLTITELSEMGQYTFDNLSGFEDFAKKAQPGDIVVTGRNFGSGSSRQQAVDCFISLGIRAIVAESFGVIYERNAINAGLPVITCSSIDTISLNNGDMVRINLKTGEITNLNNGKSTFAEPFSEVQFEIYQKGGLLAG
ncbi:MAG: 3-isopropylmalate dehydratase large subunit [Bacteroidales bacterium]|nr:3-isopropylmalate dehydratase large subunit [Bacteroidales bacterium]